MTWPEILQATGMLTRSQSDLIDKGAWDHALKESHWIVYKDAIWDPHQFQRGAHRTHRILVSSCYLALRESITEWDREITHGEVSADARFRLDGSPLQYWLEADTGKETRRQWLIKLDRYRSTFWDDNDLLVIVAAGRTTRLGRLRSWVEEARLPLPWILLSSHELDIDYSHWIGHTPTPAAIAPISPPSVEYWVDDYGKISDHEVSQWIQQGYSHRYTKIVAGAELRVLIRARHGLLKNFRR